MAYLKGQEVPAPEAAKITEDLVVEAEVKIPVEVAWEEEGPEVIGEQPAPVEEDQPKQEEEAPSDAPTDAPAPAGDPWMEWCWKEEDCTVDVEGEVGEVQPEEGGHAQDTAPREEPAQPDAPPREEAVPVPAPLGFFIPVVTLKDKVLEYLLRIYYYFFYSL
eukprot:TRINITY_DN6113_c3_g1_i4.p2 TRINITY_DN6113_c3_g1~~TRINITY_DN6113_c3_g1_i4.p2  ORF type:complete len:162 (+),score=41.37 TRINITY_DN6113_c3_g1_i4:301-786(+)